jgi:hypothetical protein
MGNDVIAGIILPPQILNIRHIYINNYRKLKSAILNQVSMT